MRKVLIGTPAHDGRVEAWYAHSLFQTGKIAAKRGVDLDAVIMSYDALVQCARNDLVALAIEHQYDDLIFIDSDQEWKPEWIFQLLAAPVDVIGGAVRKKSDIESYNVRASLPIENVNGLLAVSGVGTGFMRLSRKALTDAWAASTPYRRNGRECRMVFDLNIVDGELVSEDMTLCDKLGALGLPIFVDPDMTCSHIGAKKYSGDFAAWLAALPH